MKKLSENCDFSITQYTWSDCAKRDYCVDKKPNMKIAWSLIHLSFFSLVMIRSVTFTSSSSSSSSQRSVAMPSEDSVCICCSCDTIDVVRHQAPGFIINIKLPQSRMDGFLLGWIYVVAMVANEMMKKHIIQRDNFVCAIYTPMHMYIIQYCIRKPYISILYLSIIVSQAFLCLHCFIFRACGISWNARREYWKK